MPQANVSKLVSQINIRVLPSPRKLRNPKGPAGRHDIIRKILTALLKYERIEVGFTTGDETRGYAERLISEAVRHKDCHKPTMELADYWIREKQVVHKLFKVLVPRFENCTTAYTRIHKLTPQYPDGRLPRSLLELRGNPFPSLTPDLSSNRNLIHNVLLDEAKKEYRAHKYAEMAEQLAQEETDGVINQVSNQEEPQQLDINVTKCD